MGNIFAEPWDACVAMWSEQGDTGKETREGTGARFREDCKTFHIHSCSVWNRSLQSFEQRNE